MWPYSDLQHGTSPRLVCVEENRPVTPTPYLTFIADQKPTLFLYWRVKKQTRRLKQMMKAALKVAVSNFFYFSFTAEPVNLPKI